MIGSDACSHCSSDRSQFVKLLIAVLSCLSNSTNIGLSADGDHRIRCWSLGYLNDEHSRIKASCEPINSKSVCPHCQLGAASSPCVVDNLFLVQWSPSNSISFTSTLRNESRVGSVSRQCSSLCHQFTLIAIKARTHCFSLLDNGMHVVCTLSIGHPRVRPFRYPSVSSDDIESRMGGRVLLKRRGQVTLLWSFLRPYYV